MDRINLGLADPRPPCRAVGSRPLDMRKKCGDFLSNRRRDANLINSLSISGRGMSGSQEDEVWRPSWETDDEVDPPGTPRPRQLAVEPDYTHPLLTPLARAQDAIAR